MSCCRSGVPAELLWVAAAWRPVLAKNSRARVRARLRDGGGYGLTRPGAREVASDLRCARYRRPFFFSVFQRRRVEEGIGALPHDTWELVQHQRTFRARPVSPSSSVAGKCKSDDLVMGSTRVPQAQPLMISRSLSDSVPANRVEVSPGSSPQRDTSLHLRLRISPNAARYSARLATSGEDMLLAVSR